MVDFSTAVRPVSVPERPVLKTPSRRELSEDVRSVRSRHPLGCWAIKLGKPSREGVMYAGFSLGVVTTRSAVLSR